MGYVTYNGTDSPHMEVVTVGPLQQSIVIMPGQTQQMPDAVCTWLVTNKPSVWATASGIPAVPEPGSLVTDSTGKIPLSQLPSSVVRDRWFIDAYGADPTGATASDAALTSARAAMGSAPGLIAFGKGTYTFTSSPAPFGLGQGLVGPGSGICTLVPQAGGDFLRVTDTRFYADQQVKDVLAGRFGGYKITGFQAPPGVASYGLHYGDITGLRVDDLVIEAFTQPGSVGLFAENAHSGWAEQALIRATVANCDTLVKFAVKTIPVTGVTTGAATTFAVAGHGLNTGDRVYLKALGGITPATFGSAYAPVAITVIDANHFTIATASTGTWTNGGTCYTGNTSFDYSEYRLGLVAFAGQNGIAVVNDAVLIGVDMRVRGNFTAGTANGSTRTDTGFVPSVLTIGVSGSTDEATIKGSLNVDVECNGAGTGHATVALVGTFNAPAAINGNARFASAGSSFAAPVGLYAGCPLAWKGQGDLFPADSDAAYQHTLNFNSRDLTTLGAATVGGGNLTIGVGTGELFYGQLASGANTVVFSNVTPNRPNSVELIIQQPSGGAAGTLTWPGAVKWAGGAPPVLSTPNGAVDRLRLWTLDATTWYGELIGKAFS